MNPGGLRVFSGILLVISIAVSNAITAEDANTKEENGTNVFGISMDDVVQEFSNSTSNSTGSCDCGPHSSGCLLKYGELLCYCDTGYVQTNSTRKGKCRLCNCGAKDVCEFFEGRPVCVCEHGRNWVTGECLPSWCDCGEKGGCSVQNGSKVCDCPHGFQEYMGKCVECDCGDGGDCKLIFGVKRCYCRDNLVESNGKCQECDCGPNSVSCKIGQWRNKQCTCKEGYATSKLYEIFDESCKRCDCGTNGIECSFNHEDVFEKQTCTCKYGDNQKTEREGEKCKECDCGFYSRSCSFNSRGETRCECIDGYRAEYESYTMNGNQYCKYIEVEEIGGGGGGGGGSGVSGWRIGTYVLAAIMSIIIIALLLTIVERNWNRSLTSPQRR